MTFFSKFQVMMLGFHDVDEHFFHEAGQIFHRDRSFGLPKVGGEEFSGHFLRGNLGW